MKTFGTVIIDSATYMLTTQPELTGREMAFDDRFELSAQAAGPLGDYIIYWIMSGDGNNAELDTLDYTNPVRVELI